MNALNSTVITTDLFTRGWIFIRGVPAMIDPDSNIERVLDLGFVGEPVEVDRTLLDLLARSEMIPVLAPVAPGRDGHTYNINADTFAGAIAGACKASRLLFLTDVPGVLDKNKKLIDELTVAEAKALIKDGTVSGGMQAPAGRASRSARSFG